ncbi:MULTISPECIES: 5-formyltetrahydrofolate cyclo-ligase [unclassified Sphingomonas]|uniref:5-formyltetrahydrofolate cyclo-ligase n=1 Tax=unclassified Sphingomonas TaxID=196159 RepID=UPI000929FA3A|nr:MULTISPECIES: 5-formyltetrahydrofolate cyclo-ligase [unclassified Sphingomonas]MBN8847734.1 5-formyltetrahydrofolate cyclo-ligase [Sphingomonas sp.]OJV31838.1 MAG: 5-formyltetrahydrofolate cyclo-ligase [Sphingomonas sp. 67-36]
MTDALSKTAIRAAARAARARFVAAHGAGVPCPAPFRALLSHGLTVASYVPLGSEADPALLARAAVEAGCAIALPHVVDRATPLRFLAWDTEAALAAGPFGLSQPHDHWAELAPDIILTPLVAFTRRLERLGQGAGHYDRAFAQFPDARRIGVALSAQEVEALPVDPWDMPLHAIATEKEWITP